MERNIANVAIVFLIIGTLGVSSVAVVQQMGNTAITSEYQNLLVEYDALETLYEQVLADYETVYDQYQSKVVEYDQLNTTYTLLLTTYDVFMETFNEVSQSLLDTRLELETLNQTYLDFLTTFEELNLTYYILTGEYDALNITYHILIQQYSQLNVTYFDLLDSYDILQGEYDSLITLYEQLESEHEILQAEYDQLLIDFNLLQEEYNSLLSDYIQLQSDFDDLQSDYDNLWLNYNTLWAAHQALQESYDTLQEEYTDLQNQYNQLLQDYNSLEQDYLTLENEYAILETSYQLLQAQYDACHLELTQLQIDYETLNTSYLALNASYIQLQANYDALEATFTIIGNWLGQQILPVKACIFGEAVRRYYLPIYLEDALSIGISTYWSNFTRYMADVVYFSSAWHKIYGDGIWANFADLHKFDYISNVFSSINDPTMDYLNPESELAYDVMRDIFCASGWMSPTWINGTHILPIWWGYTDESPYIENRWECPSAIHQWVIDNIEYEYDSEITINQYPDSDWDYIKFPVETAFRTLGDCEDQAVLDAAYLRSCGFEVAVGVWHDDFHPVYGSFYHGTLWINLDLDGNGIIDPDEDTPYNEIRWTFDGSPYTWVALDPTWDTPFGETPAWLQGYIDNGISSFGSDRMHRQILTKP